MDESVSSESAQHTPGPWEWVFNGTGGQWALVHRKASWHTLYVNLGGPPDVPLTLDQKLVAAAPDLLKALKNLCRTFPTDSDMIAAGWDGLDVSSACSAYDEAKAVIAKATS